MIYTETEMKNKILQMLESFEDEVVEFKEAKSNYSFKDIGKYFSALGNEANIRGKKEGWLIFGVTNQKKVIGTHYREDEHVSPLPMEKVDLIRSQIGVDWSKEIVEDAAMDDLDEEAVKYACELFVKKQKASKKSTEMLEKMSYCEILNKAGILIKGKITNTAFILLGKEESQYLFDGFLPRITWTLYNGNGSVKAYEHFDMPLLLAVDKVYAKIRNEKYRYIAGQQTLFPDEVDQYDSDVVKEVLNNCIAHSNYQLRGKINVEEFEDRLVFINEGSFIPETSVFRCRLIIWRT